MEYRKRQKSPFRFIIWAIILVFTLFFIIQSYWSYLLSPVDAKGGTQDFTISEGEGVSSISHRLEQSGLIRSQLAFEILLKLEGKGSDLQAGKFILSQNQSAEQIIQALGKGVNEKWVTLIEGWRDEEMANKLHQVLGIDQQQFLADAKEGYMFPDSYAFDPNITVADVVKKLEDTFNQKYTDSLKQQIENNGLTADQGVILASIVEREARGDNERKNVASILLKRFKIGMALEADATVQFALGYQSDAQSWWKKSLTLDDLQVDSLYNTYTHTGLPPTPICNTSLSSLNAVAEADPAIPYLFYYHDSKGNIYYAKTLQEHDQNIAEHP